MNIHELIKNLEARIVELEAEGKELKGRQEIHNHYHYPYVPQPYSIPSLLPIPTPQFTPYIHTTCMPPLGNTCLHGLVT